MRIVVTGGGTGGHIFPALEIAKELKLELTNAEIIFVGNSDSLEERMAQKAGLHFYGIACKKIVGQSVGKKILALIYLKLAVLQCAWFLLKNRPRAVIGVGGYVSAPIILASFFLGIKRYICEQNVVPGLTNRWLAKIATAVFISFAASKKYFPEHKTLLTGNPVRKDFFLSTPKATSEGLRILITGGSLGAKFLNQELPLTLKNLHSICPQLSITHQTGQHEIDHVKSIYREAGIDAHVTTFIDDMAHAFRSHDLLVSRAGATVCAEIMASGMPSILVPYPHANAHQQYNAYALSEKGAAITITESTNFKDHLASVIKDLYSDHNKLRDLGASAKSLGGADAASTIVQHIANEIS